MSGHAISGSSCQFWFAALSSHRRCGDAISGSSCHFWFASMPPHKRVVMQPVVHIVFFGSQHCLHIDVVVMQSVAHLVSTSSSTSCHFCCTCVRCLSASSTVIRNKNMSLMLLISVLPQHGSLCALTPEVARVQSSMLDLPKDGSVASLFQSVLGLFEGSC
jgi:hypothetical protein